MLPRPRPRRKRKAGCLLSPMALGDTSKAKWLRARRWRVLLADSAQRSKGEPLPRLLPRLVQKANAACFEAGAGCRAAGRRHGDHDLWLARFATTEPSWHTSAIRAAI